MNDLKSYKELQKQYSYYKSTNFDPDHPSKSRLLAMILCCLLGELGFHRFYVGKHKTGILYILTFGAFGIGTLVDMISIARGTFTDSYGNTLGDDTGGNILWLFLVISLITRIFTYTKYGIVISILRAIGVI